MSLYATRLLLDALRPNQTPTQWESDRINAKVGWDDLSVRAIALGLAPQLHSRMTGWALPVPKRAAEKLLAMHDASAKRNAAIKRQLCEALQAFAAQGIMPVVLKGAHLAALVYDDPAHRPMNDIDLLFMPSHLSRAEQILASLGYSGKHKPAEMGAGVTKHTSTFLRQVAPGGTPNPYLSAEADRMIEPHGSLEESWFGLKVDITPNMRERALAAQMGDQPCLVLCNDDLLLHLCTHFSFHLIMGAPSLVQLMDLPVVTQKLEIDWPTFIVRADETRAMPFVFAALSLAVRLMGAAVPADALREIEASTPMPIRQRIKELDLPDVMRRTQQKPLRSIIQRIGRGLADRAETARWATDWRGRWRVWQTAFNVAGTDTAQLILRRLER